ncbi:MAG: 4Fe-4S binding protein [Desulfatiglandales bacterium]
MRFQRKVQVSVFFLFALLLGLASYPLPAWLEVDIFLRLDPLIALGSMAAARTFIPRVTWALLILGITLILGRFFCGYLCPMGATIDLTDWIFRGKNKGGGQKAFEEAGRFRNMKYLLMTAVFGTALLGVSSLFLFSPLSLITRFYALVITPLVFMAANLFLDILRPVFPLVGLENLSFLYLKVPRFSTNLFLTFLMGAIFLLALVQPRFWCRNLCPAGAILALFGRKPMFRRHVSEHCTGCGRCLRVCPMAAIGRDFVITAHSECIICLRCREVCPVGAVSFKVVGERRTPEREIDVGRRKILGAGLSGVAAAALTLTNLHHIHGGEDPRRLHPARLIRPPGALPEPVFQARCVRCGVCMKGCLTNTLQPVWFEAGLAGLWTPQITARMGGCEQNCNVCGMICPTGAIRPLDLEEKKHAKIGTARIIKTRCIAWEQDRSCLICDEICPYNAISNQFTIGHAVPVPVISENRCNGCGFCENKCPVNGEAAIVVEPLGELRLASGSYIKRARDLGLVYHDEGLMKDDFILDETGRGKGASGSSPEQKEASESDTPPGFTD